MDRIKKESDWYDQVRIEIRASSPRQKLYQVMRLHPREAETHWLTLEQAKEYCEKNKLKLMEILDTK